MFEAMNRSCKP